jgi:CDP-diacylglycerol--serine O-phosphatidyltransferase
MKKHIPNLITCCNLLCGAMAVLLATQGKFILSFTFIILGAVFDFFDGMAARKLGVSGPLGVQMDSLADDITFGLAPAVMLTCFLHPAIGNWSLIALLMASMAAVRLAKFNIDTRQTTSFIGIATPANALFWGGITCLPAQILTWQPLAWILLCMSLVSGWLMVSEIPFFSLKMHSRSWHDNRTQYIFLIGCVVLLAFCIFEAVRYEQPSFACFAGTACIVWYVTVNCLSLLTTPRK